ncbi:DMT family transporter [Qipengyuania sp. XHP0207]|uniref:DMT family transporter n=1 Tax=Qipengyuania sp. XHP0207 TaxID=3038078 RepID=UPI002420079D|nr:DMT family transporter [Qipengyuania sp. XHP0207]MDG5747577.1 DMT family transporter [Qipengyuania sp. XHP0207]
MLLTFTALFWAGNAIVARAARELVPPVALAFWRWTIALAIILPFAWGHLRRDAPVIRANWKMLLVLGALGIGAFNTLLYTGLQETTALNAMLLQSGQPALILFLGAIFMGDRTTLRQIVGAAIALTGVLWIIARGNVDVLGTLSFNEGDLVIGLAVCFWAIYAVMLRHRPTIHPLSLFAVTLVIGIAEIAPFYALELSSDRHIVLQQESLLAIGYVSIFPSILAYLFFNRGVELIGSAGTGMYMNIMPIMGAGLAIVFLGEHLRGLRSRKGRSIVVAFDQILSNFRPDFFEGPAQATDDGIVAAHSMFCLRKVDDTQNAD